VLNPVGDPLSGNGCGSPNHTYSLSYLFLVYFPVLQLTQRRRRDHTYTQLSSPSTALIRYRPPAIISFKFLSIPPRLFINRPWTHVAKSTHNSWPQTVRNRSQQT